MKNAVITEAFEVPNPVAPVAVREYPGKRALDLSIAVPLLLVTAPLVLLLWCAVRCTGGSGFFGHRRIGRNGRSFVCWKLRTMVPDAQRKLRKLLAADSAASQQWHLNFKIADDPRVTRLGAILRKFRLDELPQLWNVVKGEMSLVGPRPVVIEELAQYGSSVQYYLECRPGVTGAWQSSGEDHSKPYQHRVRLDVEYANKMSLRSDLTILIRTGLVVFRATGK